MARVELMKPGEMGLFLGLCLEDCLSGATGTILVQMGPPGREPGRFESIVTKG